MRKHKIFGNMRNLSKRIPGGRLFQTEVRARTKALRWGAVRGWAEGMFEKQHGV